MRMILKTVLTKLSIYVIDFIKGTQNWLVTGRASLLLCFANTANIPSRYFLHIIKRQITADTVGLTVEAIFAEALDRPVMVGRVVPAHQDFAAGTAFTGFVSATGAYLFTIIFIPAALHRYSTSRTLAVEAITGITDNFAVRLIIFSPYLLIADITTHVLANSRPQGAKQENQTQSDNDPVTATSVLYAIISHNISLAKPLLIYPSLYQSTYILYNSNKKNLSSRQTRGLFLTDGISQCSVLVNFVLMIGPNHFFPIKE